MNVNYLTEKVIASAIEVHRALGPGLVESIYEECTCRELLTRAVPYQRQVVLPLEFKGVRLDPTFQVDLLVAGSLVVEIKSVESLLPVHEAQMLTCMKLGGWKVGLLINFNVPLLKMGIKRRVLGLAADQDICAAR